MTKEELEEWYRDSDMDGLPDRIDSAPTIPQYYYCHVAPYQEEYLHDFFGFWFEIRNGIARVLDENRKDLDAALNAADALERQHAKIDNPF